MGDQARHAEEAVAGAGVVGELDRCSGLAQSVDVRVSLIGQWVEGRHHYER